MKFLQKKSFFLSSLIGLYLYTLGGIAYSQDLSGGPSSSNQNGSQNIDNMFNLKVTKEKFNDLPDSIRLPNEGTLELDNIFFPNVNSTLGDLSGLDILTLDKLKARFERKSKRTKNGIQIEQVPDIYEIDLSSMRDESRSLINRVNIGYKNKSAYMNVNLGKGNGQKVVKKGSSPSQNSGSSSEQALDDIRSLIQDGNIKQASINIDKLALKSQKDSWALAELAGICEQMGKYSKANIYYAKALAINPDRIELLYSYGHSLYKIGKLDKSEKYMKKVLTIDPNFTLAHYNLGNIYFKKAQYYKSLDEFNESIKQNPLMGDSYYNAALILEILGQKDLAIKYYKKCLELQPNDNQAKNALGRLQKKSNTKLPSKK